ncbi:MAG: hypothetical protein K0R57_4194 [Paenibacillaceae bacterium]|jgi:hypothetical protein|nr:hypothetical protein [Paenibacillaceae bacterium]
MLSFQQKADICASFPQLERKDVSLGRLNFSYEGSAYEKKTVVYHLHPNGNGFVYGALLPDVITDNKGFVNIRELNEPELRDLIGRAIRSMSGREEEEQAAGVKPRGGTTPGKQTWSSKEGQQLQLFYEDELWYIYAGVHLEAAFETLEEAEEYLEEEGFSPASPKV